MGFWHPLREPNVLIAVGFVQHRLDPSSAAVYQVFLQLRRAVFACDLARDAWNHVCDDTSVTKQGPLAVLRSLSAFCIVRLVGIVLGLGLVPKMFPFR